MKYFFLALLTGSLFAPAAYADNVAACEIVLMEEIEDEEMQGSASVASYRDAADFIASVYDEEEGHINRMDDMLIRGVMCERRNIIPSIRDFPIVATGIPFSLSQNFDSTTSGLLTIYFKDGEFQSQYSGPDLNDSEKDALEDALETYNLQPHDLDKREKKNKDDSSK